MPVTIDKNRADGSARVSSPLRGHICICATTDIRDRGGMGKRERERQNERRGCREERRGGGVVSINQIDWCDVERSQSLSLPLSPSLSLSPPSFSPPLSLPLFGPLHLPRQNSDRPYTTCPIANPFNSFLAV